MKNDFLTMRNVAYQGFFMGKCKVKNPLLLWLQLSVVLFSFLLVSCGGPEKRAGGVTDIGNSISGVITDASGLRVQRAQLKLINIEKVDTLFGSIDSAGYFEFNQVYAGEWVLVAETPSGLSKLDLLSLQSSDSSASIELELSMKKNVQGRIDVSAMDYKKVLVYVQGYTTKANPDSKGWFELTEVPPGTYALCIDYQGQKACHNVHTIDERTVLDIPDLRLNIDKLEVIEYKVGEEPADYSTRDFSGYTDEYVYQKNVRLDLSFAKSLTENIADFPLALRLDSTQIDFTKLAASGDELQIRDSSGQLLKFEIETWNVNNKSALVWVHLPQVSNSQNSMILTIVAQGLESNIAASIFSKANHFSAVYHLQEFVAQDSAKILDASENLYHGFVVKKASPYKGKLGNALLLNADSQRVVIGNWNPFESDFTVSMWVQWNGPSKQHQILVAKRNSWNGGQTMWQWHYDMINDSIGVYHIADTRAKFAYDNIPLQEWVHLAMVYHSADSTLQMFANGVATSAPLKSSIGIATDALLSFGGNEAGETWNGALDEVRFESVARSADWIRLCYETQK